MESSLNISPSLCALSLPASLPTFLHYNPPKFPAPRSWSPFPNIHCLSFLPPSLSSSPPYSPPLPSPHPPPPSSSCLLISLLHPLLHPPTKTPALRSGWGRGVVLGEGSRPGSDCSLLGPPRSGRPPGCLGVSELASQASFGDMQGWRVPNTHLGERRGTAVDPPWSA